MTRLLNAKRGPVRGNRPPAVRTWNGPLIGREPEPVEAYLARLAGLVADGRTHLYFDASFLMWLAKVGENARREFLDWQSAVGETRFHVPLWAAHEFFKHRLKKTVPTELSREIKAFDSAASSLYEKLRIYCSDRLFGFMGSGTLFMDEYRRTVQPLRSMLKLAEGSDQYEMSVQQVSTYVDARLLPGPLHEVIADIEADERIRNRGVIPPSFKDAHKRGGKRADAAGEETATVGDNSFGDLAFWREVLRHAVGVRAGAVVVLTADRKNDWFENHHGDAGLTPDIRKQLGRPRPVPAPHPLLVREAFDRGAGDLALIDPMYCAVLIERAGVAFTSLAAAALDTHLPEPEKKAAAVRSWARRFGSEARLLGERREPDEDGVSDETPFDAALLSLDLLPPATTLPASAAEIIRRIAEGDLAARATVFASLNAKKLEQWDVPSLVALGRSALRAAEAEDAAALEFLSKLRDHAPEFQSAVREPLFFGALGAVYLDDQLAARLAQGSNAAMVLLSLVTAPEVRKSALALGVALGERDLFYRPGETEDLKIDVIFQPSANNKSPADLLAIKLNGVDLITTLQTEERFRFTTLLDRPAGAADVQVGALLEVLTRFHLLPRQLIQTETNVDMFVHVPEFAGVELDV